MKTCKEYVAQYVDFQDVDTINVVRYGRQGYWKFKPEHDSNVEHYGPLIVKVMKKHLDYEFSIFGNRSVTSSHRLID